MKRLTLSTILLLALALCSSPFSVQGQGPGSRPPITPESAATVTELGILDAGDFAVLSIDFSPDGATLLTGHPEGVIYQWDLATGDRTQMTSSVADGVSAATYSPDGKYIASDIEQNIIIWDSQTGEQAALLTGHTDWVQNLAYSPDGKLLASGAGDSTIRIWDVETSETLHVLSPNFGPSDVAFSPDGTQIAATDGNTEGINLWDVATGEKLDGLMLPDVYHGAIAYSPDGARIAALGVSYPSDVVRKVYIWDVATAQTVQEMEIQEGVEDRDIAFSPVSDVVFSASDVDVLRMWDVERGSGFSPLRGDFLATTVIAVSPDGSLLASGTADGLISLWGVADGGPLPYPPLEAFTPQPGHWEGRGSSVAVSFDVNSDGDITNLHWRQDFGQDYCTIERPEVIDVQDNRFSFAPDGQVIEGKFRSATSLLGRSNVQMCGNMFFFSTGGPPTWWAHRVDSK